MVNQYSQKIHFVIAYGLSILSILISSFVVYKLSKIGEFETREFQSNRDALIDVLDKAVKYAEPYTVDWGELDQQVHYTNYQCPGLNKYSNYETFKTHFDSCSDYDTIQKAKVDFHRTTVKARILGSDKIVATLQGVEDGFDEVLDYYFQHNYYSRALPDAYETVMPEKFANLERVFKEEINRK